jgi:hypothetical protein
MFFRNVGTYHQRTVRNPRKTMLGRLSAAITSVSNRFLKHIATRHVYADLCFWEFIQKVEVILIYKHVDCWALNFCTLYRQYRARDVSRNIESHTKWWTKL